VRGFLDGLYRVSGGVAAFCILLIAVLVVAQVIGRLLGVLVPGADDIAGYALTASSFLGLAYTLRTGSHIRLTLLLRVSRPRARRALETACLALGAFSIGYLAVHVVEMVRDAWRFNDRAQGVLAIPLWIPQSVMAAGALVLFVAFVDDLVAVLRGAPPSYDLARGDAPSAPITRDA
jgi:TRAP-type C4-dicarboxylate transport system permease small subunit